VAKKKVKQLIINLNTDSHKFHRQKSVRIFEICGKKEGEAVDNKFKHRFSQISQTKICENL
jgi:hypothetical protein